VSQVLEVDDRTGALLALRRLCGAGLDGTSEDRHAGEGGNNGLHDVFSVWFGGDRESAANAIRPCRDNPLLVRARGIGRGPCWSSRSVVQPVLLLPELLAVEGAGWRGNCRQER